MEKKLLTLRDVLIRVSLGRSTLYRLMESADFPRPVKIGAKSVRWRIEAVDDWVAGLPAGDVADAPLLPPPPP